MTEWTWNDGMGSRGRQPACLVITPAGDVVRFVGQSIPGVAHVVRTKYEKNGKWSNSTYHVASPDGTATYQWSQSWEEGLYWPQGTWGEAVEAVAKVAPHVKRDSLVAAIRADWGKAAQKFDATAAALAALNAPTAPVVQEPSVAVRYVLNSAVITAPGTYQYEVVTVARATAWLQAGPFTSAIGYAETADALGALSGVEVPVNRVMVQMVPGDEALVCRLSLPKGADRVAPTDKGALTPEYVAEHAEFGILRAL